MPKVTRFEDLKCWKAARALTNYVYNLCETPILERKFTLRNQLERASVSVMNNIAEGFGRLYKREKIKFLNIASSSCCELKSMSYLLLDRGLIDESGLTTLHKKINSAYFLIMGFISYLYEQLTSNSSPKS